MSGVAESTFRGGLLTPENITQFKPGEADDVFAVLGVRQGLPKSRYYGSRVITGVADVLELFAKRGTIIKKLYGTSRTRDGIRLAKELGFRQVTPDTEEDDLLRFELDLMTTEEPLFRHYQEIVKRASAATPKSKISRSEAHKLEI